ncbi:MAG: MFS transporter [Candidatus Alcyoniella australis]|nr:MFS transporter [Candidatus Alcyoniella australis]
MSDAAAGQEGAISRGYARYVFVLLFLLYMFDYTDRMVVVSLFEHIKLDWGINDTQCGMLVSAVYWSILVFALPCSMLVDRWSRRRTIGMMALLWSLATGACAFTRNYRQMFAARSLVGIGEAGYSPGGTAMIAALFPENKRSTVMGIWNASIPLGSALGVALGGFVAVHWGWRHAFGLVALPGMIIALLFFRIRDYRTVELIKPADKKQERVRMRRIDVLREFTRNGTLIFTYLGFAANTFVTTSLLSWLPAYYHRIDGLPMDRAGLKGGLVMLPAMIGAPLGGYLVDRWRRKRENARPLFAALSSSLFALVLFTAMVLLQGAAQYAMLLLAGALAVFYLPAAAATTQDVIHPGLRATSYGLCVIVQNLLGSSLGPIFVGALSDRYGLHTGLSMLPLFAAMGGLLFFIASQFHKRDLALVERVEISYEG